MLWQLKAGDDAAAMTLQGMLRKSAALYHDLIRHATDNGVPVPEEAALGVSVNGEAHPEAEEGCGPPSISHLPCFICLFVVFYKRKCLKSWMIWSGGCNHQIEDRHYIVL